MNKLGKLNSRMKDFYDIWLLASQFNFKGTDLRDSVDRTFRKREVVIPENAIVFSEEFAEAKKIQWNAFRKKLRQSDVPENFYDVIFIIKNSWRLKQWTKLSEAIRGRVLILSSLNKS